MWVDDSWNRVNEATLLIWEWCSD